MKALGCDRSRTRKLLKLATIWEFMFCRMDSDPKQWGARARAIRATAEKFGKSERVLDRYFRAGIFMRDESIGAHDRVASDPAQRRIIDRAFAIAFDRPQNGVRKH